MPNTLRLNEKDIKSLIISKVFISESKDKWIFDFRKVLLNSQFLSSISTIFFDQIRKDFKLVQVCGLEVAAVPLLGGILMKSFEEHFEMSGFFIRKSRKKTGLLNIVEGEVNSNDIVIVDDILNTGNSILRQIKIIEEMGKKVSAVYVIVRFRDVSQYSFLQERGIKIYSMFTLDDFKVELNLSLLDTGVKKELAVQPFTTVWTFKDFAPNYALVIPKSAPLFYNDRLFFGSDSGNFYCLNALDGSIIWEYRIFFGSKGKLIMSSPCIYKDTIYFGAYDGNFYALDSITGKVAWVFLEADWIGSSPCVSIKNKLVYIGVEFGVFKKKGGLVAIDAITGKKVWNYYEMNGLTHASPAVSEKHNVVVCGCNDAFVYAFNAKNGKLLWKFETKGEVKASCCFDEKKGMVFFGSFDHYVYALDILNGNLVWKFETNEAVYSTPLFYQNKVYVASLDKNIYCLSSKNGEKIWSFATSGRIFADPVVIQDEIYIGSNDSRMYVFNKDTGNNIALHQMTERITNKVAFDEKRNILFLPTFANEIHALSRDSI